MWSSSLTRAKYDQILKNSVAFKETASERIFVMKDLAAVEEAVGLWRGRRGIFLRLCRAALECNRLRGNMEWRVVLIIL